MDTEREDSDLPTFGRYRTVQVLGEGAMASVYLAKDPHLSRRVAIKVVRTQLLENEEAIKRFRTEAKVLANLRHPNILQVFDYDVEDDRHFLVMEYVEGPGFQALLDSLEGKPLPPRVAAWFLHQAAQGLAAAHKQGLVHRDIKPDNMLLTADGTLKIADFGIAHVVDLGLTQAGDILGTPYYMAPEQTLAETPVPQTDLWALGVVLYLCLTGRRPFEGQGLTEIKRRIREGAYRPLSAWIEDVDADLAGVVDTLLSLEPEKRGTAQDLALRLKRYLDKTGIEDWETHIRDYLGATLAVPLGRTMVEFAAEPEPPKTAKPGTRKGSTASRKRRGKDDEDDEEDSPEAMSGPDINLENAEAGIPGTWNRFWGSAKVWIWPVVFMIGMQVYVRWSVSNPPVPQAVLQIRSSPPGAVVFLDDDELGLTPMTQMLKPAAYRIKATHSAFPGQVKDTMVYVSSSGTSKADFKFTRP